LTIHQQYMHRCLQLAKLGAGDVAPNPMVGAVLVYEDRIIGEGYHQKYGEAHAEVNCINQAIHNGHAELISQSTIYVSLEPCAHFGKTPPCADLIIRHKIPKAVIGCRDPFKEVDGKGIEKLKAAGIEVETGILEKECKELNKRFFTFHTQQRPYIILKWAQTADGFMAASPEGGTSTRLLISNEYTNRLVHKWRSEEVAILVGTNTVVHDDPELTTRLWPGTSPVRLIVDMHLRLPSFLKVFDGKIKTIVFNAKRHSEDFGSSSLPKIAMTPAGGDSVSYYQVTEDVSLVHQIVNALYQLKIQSVIVEGGAVLLQSFIDEEIWDEVRIITNTRLTIGNGLAAPKAKGEYKKIVSSIFTDNVITIKRDI
jgi:diaminohydroxyphosphoribosylaminopyrimidine deaminase / 5-amino-6-(5-phosphoribosylamino)uracil reductase